MRVEKRVFDDNLSSLLLFLHFALVLSTIFLPPKLLVEVLDCWKEEVRLVSLVRLASERDTCLTSWCIPFGGTILLVLEQGEQGNDIDTAQATRIKKWSSCCLVY